MEIPKHWKEWTRITVAELKEDLTLADISFVLGEAIMEEISRGATEFMVEIDEDRITIACNKGGLEEPMGYNSEKVYKELFK